MCYARILNVENVEGGTLMIHLAGKTLGLLAHRVIRSQVQARTSVRMHSVRAHVMPYHTVTLQDTHSSLDIYI